MDQSNVATQQGATQTDSPESSGSIVDSLSRLINSPDAPEQPPEETREAEQSEQPAQASTEPEEPAARTVKVKIDGEERDVPIDEVVTAYQKDSAAAKRFEEAARLRREADDIAGKVSTERQHLAQALEVFTERLNRFGPKEPDISLLQTDPVEYLRQQAEHQQATRQLQEAEAAKAYLARQQQQEAQQMQARMLEAEMQNLMKALPHWSDQSKAEKEKSMVAGHLKALGFPPEQIAQINDHRLVVLARESALYREIMNKAKDTAKQVAKAPARVERPGVAGTNLDGRTAAMQRLARTGRVEDAAEVFKGLI